MREYRQRSLGGVEKSVLPPFIICVVIFFWRKALEIERVHRRSL